MESFCFRPPPTLLGISSPTIAIGLDVRATSSSAQFIASSLPATGSAAGDTKPAAPSASQLSYIFPAPLRRLWPRRREKGNDDEIAVEEEGEEKVEEEQESPRGGQRGNWVFKILRVKEIWGEEKGEGRGGVDGVLERSDDGSGDRIIDDAGDRCVGCHDEPEGCSVGGGEDAVEFDRDSFSRLLRPVSLAKAKLYAQLSYLGSLAYTIPKIDSINLLKDHGLRFVTSSLEMKLKPSNAEQERLNTQQQETEVKEEEDGKSQRKNGYLIDTSAAYRTAISAASYLQSQTKSILPFKSAEAVTGEASPEEGSNHEQEADITNSEMASFVATTDSVTAMVAAKEETKQAVAKDLNSALSSPCEWFICDDDSSHTRLFVIQGSESLASWQANLLFEPIQFEGLDVLVHRGIYEAAKGIYEQMLPEVQSHLRYHRKSAALRFTGHSLGGSLALLVNLMLLIRGEAPPSSLLPVVTFGSPSIMCGGNYLLRMLELPQSHLQAIMMHRDIVPRAFSCNYPDHVAEILKAVNGKFRNHPCLENQKMLYVPMGELLILQPDEKLSPHHHLLPSGSGMYMFGHPLPNSNAALSVFLNSPHPLETLSDRSAYGSEGTINRDHDMNAYLRAIRGVIRRELKRVRKAKREHRRQAWWPIGASQEGIHSGSVTMGRQAGSKDSSGSGEFSFSGMLQGGSEPLKRFARLVASGHVNLLVMLLLPARAITVSGINNRWF